MRSENSIIVLSVRVYISHLLNNSRLYLGCMLFYFRSYPSSLTDVNNERNESVLLSFTPLDSGNVNLPRARVRGRADADKCCFYLKVNLLLLILHLY